MPPGARAVLLALAGESGWAVEHCHAPNAVNAVIPVLH
jgi:hypothetical protein